MNSRHLVFLFLFVVCFSACKQRKMPIEESDKSNAAHSNALVNETSPYLLQHAHNPVNWYPWGKEAIKKAKDENKMMIVSIGYAACHWCHVMERESFENEEVAQIMNDNFVCVKVDKEERPDVDEVYMSAANLITGRGGWPLNAFATSEGKPFWAGTYFPKDRWMDILDQFIKIKAEEPEKLEESANKILEGIATLDQHTLITQEVSSLAFDKKEIDLITNDFIDNYDMKEGGRKGSPKFPMPSNLQYLLQYHGLTGDDKALEMVKVSLNKMAYGGIYDQVGGGFSRYSTDGIWLVPHFEKMLYDNGQLLSIYADAYKLTKDPLYKKVIEETVDYLKEEMDNGEGGFYASFDADSEGVEGKYYVWTETEIDQIISDAQASAIFKDYYSVSAHGNWEEKNILAVNEKFELKVHNISQSGLEESLKASLAKLKNFRKSRIKPGLDDKTLCSWNALTISGLVKSYQALEDPQYLKMAIEGQKFIAKNMTNGKGLFRTYKEGKASINGFLDDYATYIQALIYLYEVTLEKKYIELADSYVKYSLDNFLDESTNMFFYTSIQDDQLVARKKVLSDNVVPSSNSMMARNLIALGTIFYNEEYKLLGKRMGLQMLDQVKQSKRPDYNGNWCALFTELAYEPYEVVVVGDDAVAKARELQKSYFANSYFAGGTESEILEPHEIKMSDDETMIYVCQNRTCKLPTSDIDIAQGLISWP